MKLLLSSVVNWKTTLAGLVTAVGTSMIGMDDDLMVLIGQVLMAVGSFLVGALARDTNKTSEQSMATDHTKTPLSNLIK